MNFVAELPHPQLAGKMWGRKMCFFIFFYYYHTTNTGIGNGISSKTKKIITSLF